MPELAALERAKELAEQLFPLGYSIIVLHRLAAALAACAREEAKWWAGWYKHPKHEGVDCQWCKRIESLERAVGEKGQA